MSTHIGSDDLLEAYQDAMQDNTQLRHQLHNVFNNTPVEDSEAFRDFVVWLCGFTDRSDLPGEKDWERLQERVKEMAAAFALRARKRDREKTYQYQLPLWHSSSDTVTRTDCKVTVK